MKKLLVLQMRPEDEAAESELNAILRVGEIDRDQVDRFRLEQDENYQYSLDDYGAIIAGGSPFDVSCPPEKKSKAQLRVEQFYKTLFDKIIPIDFPFLGACSGNGLLGNYCGTAITRKYAEPVGSVEVAITQEGVSDPLLQGLPKNFTAFVGHKEACDEAPAGATLLATSASCPVQMFRLKKNIYATQFHPEADANEFILRIKTYQSFGYFKPEESEKLIEAIKKTNTPSANEILRRFVNRFL
jgi:GMP synthase (glutamine-hydrolysing)